MADATEKPPEQAAEKLADKPAVAAPEQASATKEPAKEVIPSAAAAAMTPPAPVGSPVAKPAPRGKLRSREPIWTLRKPLPTGAQLWFGIALPVVVLALWIGLTAGKKPILIPVFLPSPLEVLRVLVRDLLTGDRVLADAALVSTVRIAAAFVAAAAVALPLGILMGAYEPINRLVDPIMAPLRYMPISAFIPLTILWFGIDEKQKLAFLFLGVFVYLLPVVVTAIRAVPEELVQTARTLGASNFQVIRSVLVPAAMPDIFDSFRVMNAISWTYVILAEFVNTTRGLGYLIKLAGDRLKTAEMFAGVIIIGAIGLGTDALLRGLGRLFYPWREGSHG